MRTAESDTGVILRIATCPVCFAEGLCVACWGNDEDCEICNGSGDCPVCEGEGEIILSAEPAEPTNAE